MYIYFLIFHILACIWYLMGTSDTYVNKDDPNEFINGWIYWYGEGYKKSDYPQIYGRAFYYVFTTITTVGFGDIVPLSNEENLLSIFIMYLGWLLFSYFSGRLRIILMSKDEL